jgi:hypothetical protein
MPRVKLATFDEMSAAIEDLGDARSRSGWSLAQVLIHIAQGIEYSVSGYPAMRSGIFRATIGRIALRKFLGAGEMSHDLQAPVPGAPSLDPSTTLADAKARLQKSIAEFRAMTGSPKPHFAYGPMSKSDAEKITAIHFANHASAFAKS